MFKAKVKVTKYTKQGWDTYEDEYLHDLEASSLESLEDMIEELNTTSSYGDFGIRLSSTKVEVLESYEVLQEEVKKIIKL